jgi:hypothetical protein
MKFGASVIGNNVEKTHMGDDTLSHLEKQYEMKSTANKNYESDGNTLSPGQKFKMMRVNNI